MVLIEQPGLFSTDDDVVVKRKHTESKPRDLVGRILMLGAGLQSSCIAEMVVEGELPRIDFAVFADTGDEPPWVYEQVWYLAGRLASVNIPLIVTYFSKTSLSQTAKTVKGKFASMPVYVRDAHNGRISMLKRQCTNDWKIEPTRGEVRGWLLERGLAKQITDKLGRTSRRVNSNVKVEIMLGISWDEITRMKDNGPGWTINTFPLIDRRMTRLACAQWLTDHGLPLPKKSSCIMCPFHDNDYWAFLEEEHPAIFEEACAFDDWLRTPEGQAAMSRIEGVAYLHRSAKPLREIDFRTKLPMEELCDGFCMT